jgi:transposase
MHTTSQWRSLSLHTSFALLLFMIDLKREKLSLTRPEVARRLACHIDTVTAYIERGHDGVRLEARRVGGRWKTSPEALDRFLDELTRRARADPAKLATVAQERRAEQDAVAFLKEQGVLK